MSWAYPNDEAQAVLQQTLAALQSSDGSKEALEPAVVSLRALANDYPDVAEAHYLLHYFLRVDEVIPIHPAPPFASTRDESIAHGVRASELYPAGSERWANSTSGIFIDLVAQDSAHLPKPAWTSNDQQRLKYSAACVSAAPRSIDAWEMRGLVCSGNRAPWLQWEPIPPRTRALLLESIHAYQQVAKLAPKGSYREQRALDKAGYSREDLDATTAAPQHMIAAMDGEVTKVEAWVRGGGDVNARDISRCTMLYFAAEAGQAEVVEKLIRLGADPNLQIETGQTALIACIQCGHVGAFCALLRAQADVELGDENGMTPLMFAAQDAKIALVGKLLAAGASVNAVTTADDETTGFGGHPRGSSALHIAVKSSQGFGVVDLLAAQKGRLTCRPEYVVTVGALLKAGASPDLVDGRGHTPVTFAAARGMLAILELFEGHALIPPLLQRRVRIVGLVARPELNGQCGVAISYDASSARYVVRLEDGSHQGDGACVKVRPTNLEADQ